jgi:hypothetical protein
MSSSSPLPAWSEKIDERGTRTASQSYPGKVSIITDETVPGSEEREYTTASWDIEDSRFRDSDSGKYTPLRWTYSENLPPDMEMEEAPTNDDIEFNSVFRIVFSALPRSISTAYEVEMSFSGMEAEITRTESFPGSATSGPTVRYYIENWAEEGDVVSMERVEEGENLF